MEQQARKNFLIAFFYYITVFFIVYISCRFLLKYLMPFLIGGVIALTVQKPSRLLSEKIKIKQSITAGCLAVAVFISLVAVFLFLLYRFFISLGWLSADIGDYISGLSDILGNIKNSIDSFLSGMSSEFHGITNKLFNNVLDKALIKLGGLASSFAANAAKNTPEFLLSTVVSAVASVYIAADFEHLVRFVRELIGKEIYNKVVKIKDIFASSILKLLKGYLILMLITFFELLAGFFIMRIKYAVLLAVLISIIDLLPVLGTGTVLVPWCIIELFLGNTALAVGLLILYVTVVLVRNFSEPKIIGGQIGINPLFTLISMFVGVKLLGIIGLIVFPVVFIVTVKYYKSEMED